MLKTSYEKLTVWVDPDTGTLHVQVGEQHQAVPREDAEELIGIADTKIGLVENREWEKKTLWERLKTNMLGL